MTIGIADEMGLSPVMLLALVATLHLVHVPQSVQPPVEPHGFSDRGLPNASFVRFGIPLFVVSLISVGIAYLLPR